jgi:hypothetical protein
MQETEPGRANVKKASSRPKTARKKQAPDKKGTGEKTT